MNNISAECSKKRQVLGQSALECDRCGKKLLIEEPGSETTRWLHCHNCGQYHYLVGEIHCCCVPGRELSKDFYEKLKKALGETSLQSWVSKLVSVLLGDNHVGRRM